MVTTNTAALLVTLKGTEAAAKRYRAAEAKADTERANLYALIREGREAGASWGDLADASGLSRERVRQVCGP